MPKIPTYLMSRNGVYYFYLRIPQKYIKALSLNRRYIRKSLKCKDRYEALIRSRIYLEMYMAKKRKIDTILAEIDGLEGQVADHYELLKLGRELLSQYDAIQENGNLNDENDFFAHMTHVQRKALDLASQEQYQKQETLIQAEDEKERRTAKIIADELSSQISGNKKSNKKSNISKSIKLKKLCDDFVHHKVVSKAWKPRSQKGNVEMLNRILDGLRYRKGSSDPCIHDFDVDDAIWFQDTFQCLPSNVRKKYAGIPITKVLKLAENNSIPVEQRLSAVTYNTYARLLTAMFEFAKDKRQRYISENVFVKLQVKVNRKGKKRIHFSDSNLQKFFSSSLYKDKDFEPQWSWRYWIPIIMLYSGMRLEEIAQLTLSDIIDVEGVMCFKVKDSYGDDDILTSSAKTDSSERTVPIHSVLLKSGFLSSYVRWLKQNNKTKLFPTLKNRNKDGEYKPAGDAVSKYFNGDKSGKRSYFSRQGIDKDETGLVLYCLKHTVETVLINHPDEIENDKIDTLIGHEVKSTGRKHYGRYNMETISRIVEKIEYPNANLPWDVNRNYNKILFPWER